MHRINILKLIKLISLFLIMFISESLRGQIKSSMVDSAGYTYLKLTSSTTEKYINTNFIDAIYSYVINGTILFQVSQYLQNISRTNQSFVFVISRTELDSISLQEVNHEYFTVSTVNLYEYTNDDGIFLINNSLTLKNGDELKIIPLDNFEQLITEIYKFYE